jgi:hypothetical protein
MNVSPNGLNPYHKNRLAHTIQHIDDLLTEAEHTLAENVSPFVKYVSDSTPLQRKVVHDYIVRGRQAMTRIVQEREIPSPTPRCGSLWAAQTVLLSAKIGAEELTPSRLRELKDLRFNYDRKTGSHSSAC